MFLVASLVLIAAACAGDGDADRSDRSDASGSTATAPPGSAEVRAASGDWYRPTASTTWQWQLSGELDTGYDVDVYDVDLFDVPVATIDELHADGRRVICYFSAGSSEDWRADHTLFPAEVQGEPLDGWEGERWLDIRSQLVLDLMLSRLDVAVEKGCDGVEPDNVQAYLAETGFDLTADDQLGFNRALASAAHDRGLSIGLKNAAELIPDLVGVFDFSVNEQCHEYDECKPYLAFVVADKPVFNAEYADRFVGSETQREVLCEQSTAEGMQTLVLPLDLDNSFRHACSTNDVTR